MGLQPIVKPAVPPIIDTHIEYLKNAYAKDRITLEELEIGLESVLAGGPINVPKATPDRIEVGRAWQ